MRTAWNLMFTLCLVLSAATAASGGEGIVVIVNPEAGVQQLAPDEIRAIFLGRHSELPSGEKTYPADQRVGSDIYNTFSRKVLKKTPARLRGSPDPKINGVRLD